MFQGSGLRSQVSVLMTQLSGLRSPIFFRDEALRHKNCWRQPRGHPASRPASLKSRSGAWEVQQESREPQRRRHVPRVSSSGASLNALCHGPTDSRMTGSRLTIGHPLPPPARRVWPVLLWRSTPGKCAPSVGVLLPEALRLSVLRFAEHPHWHGGR